MLVLHVSPPVVLPREGLTTLSRIGAVVLCAEVLPRLCVFVVDVSF